MGLRKLILGFVISMACMVNASAEQEASGDLILQNVRYSNGDIAAYAKIYLYYQNAGLWEHTEVTLDGTGSVTTKPAAQHVIPVALEGPDANHATITIYPETTCSDGLENCLPDAVPIAVPNSGNVIVDDMRIFPESTLTIQYEISEWFPEWGIGSGTEVALYDEEFDEQQGLQIETPAYGARKIRGLNPGSFYVHSRALLYPEIPCFQLGMDCNVSMGDSINISAGERLTIQWPLPVNVEDYWHISFNASRLPFNAATPYNDHQDSQVIAVSTETGEVVATGTFEFLSNELMRLTSDSVYLFADIDQYHHITAYPDVRCASFDIESCESTPTAVSRADHDGEELIFDLQVASGIRISVPEGVGEVELIVDIWLWGVPWKWFAWDGGHPEGVYDSVRLKGGQSVDVALPHAVFHLSTEVLQSDVPLHHTVYPDLACSEAPARVGTCDLSGGEGIIVSPAQPIREVEIPLLPKSEPVNFAAGDDRRWENIVYGRLTGDLEYVGLSQEMFLFNTDFEHEDDTRLDQFGRFTFSRLDEGYFSMHYGTMFWGGSVCEPNAPNVYPPNCEESTPEWFLIADDSVNEVNFEVPEGTRFGREIVGDVLPVDASLSILFQNLDNGSRITRHISENNSGFSTHTTSPGRYHVLFLDQQGNGQYYREAICSESCATTPATIIEAGNDRVELGSVVFSGGPAVLGGQLPDFMGSPETRNVCAIEVGASQCQYFAVLGDDNTYRFYDLPTGQYHLLWFGKSIQPLVYPDKLCLQESYSDCIGNNSAVVSVVHGSQSLNRDFSSDVSASLVVSALDAQAQLIQQPLDYLIFNNEGDHIRTLTAAQQPAQVVGLQSGDYYVVVRSASDATEHLAPTAFPNIYCPILAPYPDATLAGCDMLHSAQAVTIDNQFPQEVAIEVSPNIPLTGRLVDDLGAAYAVTDGIIKVFAFIPDSGRYEEVDSAPVGENGAFSAYVPPGRIKVRISSRNSGWARWVGATENCAYLYQETGCGIDDAPELTLNASSAPLDLGDIVFPQKGTLEIYDNAPLEDSIYHRIIALDSGIDVALAVPAMPGEKSANKGGFNLRRTLDLAPGQYVVQLFSSSYAYFHQWSNGEPCQFGCNYTAENVISIHPRETTQLQFSPQRTPAIMLNFSDSSFPVPEPDDVSIELVDANGQPVNVGAIGIDTSTGNFRFRVLSDSPFRMRVSAEGFYPHIFPNIDCANTPACDIELGELISPQGNFELLHEFQFTPKNSVFGTVRDQAGVPLANVEVELNAIEPYGHFQHYGTVTSGDGSFSFDGVAYRNYLIYPQKNGYTYEPVVVPGSCQNQEHCYQNLEVFEVSEELQSIQLDLTLFEHPKFVLHDLVDQSGNPLNQNEYSVYLISIDGRYTWDVPLSTDTNRFEQNVAPGSYHLGAYRTGDQTQVRYFYEGGMCAEEDKECRAQSTLFELLPGEEVVVDEFAIVPPVSVQMQFTSFDSALLVENVTVTLYDTEGVSLPLSAHTGTNGVAVFDGLYAGSYRAQINAEQTDGLFPDSLLFDVLCDASQLGQSCKISDGEIIEVPQSHELIEMHFQLRFAPHFKLDVRDSISHKELEHSLRIFNAEEGEINPRIYRFNGTAHVMVSEGDYYAAAAAGQFYSMEAFPDSSCEHLSLSWCEPGYQPITASFLNPEFAHIQLDLLQGLTGFVRDRITLEPVPDVEVDLWSGTSANPIYREMETTTGNGGFAIPATISQGMVSTVLPPDSPYYNALYQDVICYQGPAILDQCDFEQATTIHWREDVTHIEILLDRDLIFINGLEPMIFPGFFSLD